jgi:hypothetical protein
LSDGPTENSGDLPPGTYSVTETVPAGWDLESATCSDGSNPSSISLQAGETVTCVFTNEKDAFIIVEKQTDPDGDPQVFDFDLSYGTDDADLSDGRITRRPDPVPTRLLRTPWRLGLTSTVCSDGSSALQYFTAAGETVTVSSIPNAVTSLSMGDSALWDLPLCHHHGHWHGPQPDYARLPMIRNWAHYLSPKRLLQADHRRFAPIRAAHLSSPAISVHQSAAGETVNCTFTKYQTQDHHRQGCSLNDAQTLLSRQPYRARQASLTMTAMPRYPTARPSPISFRVPTPSPKVRWRAGI